MVIFLCAALGLAGAGCGKQNSADTKPAAKPANEPTDAVVPSVIVDDVQVVKLTGDDTMHFNGNRFTVHVGQTVRVELTNKGVRPTTEMAHDFVLLKPGVDAMLFNLACAQAKEQQYLPAKEAEKTITHTSLAGPGETVAASFTAPDPGQYTFLCNFPGHYAAGMRGTMTVLPPEKAKSEAP